MDLYAMNADYRTAIDNLAASYRCIHCDAAARLVPASCGRRVLEVMHERGCPDHEDFADDAA